MSSKEKQPNDVKRCMLSELRAIIIAQYIHVSSCCIIYAVNLFNVICPLHLNKTGKKSGAHRIALSQKLCQLRRARLAWIFALAFDGDLDRTVWGLRKGRNSGHSANKAQDSGLGGKSPQTGSFCSFQTGLFERSMLIKDANLHNKCFQVCLL